MFTNIRLSTESMSEPTAEFSAMIQDMQAPDPHDPERIAAQRQRLNELLREREAQHADDPQYWAEREKHLQDIRRTAARWSS